MNAAEYKNEEEKIAALEALLFQYGEQIQIKKLSSLLNLKEDECRNLINIFSESLATEEKSGLTLLVNGNFAQLVTKPSFQFLSERITQEEFRQELTPAGLETISIIAYLGPISRSAIDYIRGVNSSFTLRNLLMRGLVLREQSAERKNMYEYYISSDFLKHMGIGNADDLPEYQKYKDILTKFEFGEIENTSQKNQEQTL